MIFGPLIWPWGQGHRSCRERMQRCWGARRAGEHRNLGGIANLTLIPPCTGADCHAALLGWDCGPANSLIDLGMRHFTDGAQHFDQGRMAAQGCADEN